LAFLGTFGGVVVLKGESFQQVLWGWRIEITLRKERIFEMECTTNLSNN